MRKRYSTTHAGEVTGYAVGLPAPYGRIPRRTRAGERLRPAARAVALTARNTSDPAMASVALIARLAELAAAVAALRQAALPLRRAGPAP